MTKRVQVSNAHNLPKPAPPVLTPGIACGNCHKYGAECPGYDKAHKFVDGKHAVRSKRAGRAGSVSTQGGAQQQLHFSVSPTTTTTTSPDPDLDSVTAVARRQSKPLPYQHAPATWPPSPSPSHHHADSYPHHLTHQQPIPRALKSQCLPLVHNMIGQLFALHPRDEIVFMAPWFGAILPYLGTATVLDAAICAYMLQLVGKAKGDAAEVRRSRDVYGQALGALQRALYHPVAWRSTETLAGTILCCVFEVSVVVDFLRCFTCCHPLFSSALCVRVVKNVPSLLAVDSEPQPCCCHYLLLIWEDFQDVRRHPRPDVMDVARLRNLETHRAAWSFFISEAH